MYIMFYASVIYHQKIMMAKNQLNVYIAVSVKKKEA